MGGRTVLLRGWVDGCKRWAPVYLERMRLCPAPTITSDQSSPLDRHEFDAAALMADHPPRVHNRNKQVVADMACPSGAVHRGTLGYSRWAAMELPEQIEVMRSDLVLPIPGFFDYRPVIGGSDALDWHVNFADPHLFIAYAGSLFAQDEMQVAEHPGLAALTQALGAAGVETRTDAPDGPTPLRCRIDNPLAARGP